MGEVISFPSTHWSLVSLAGREDKEGMREALGHVLRLYSPALRAHLELQKRVLPDAAEDMVSGFISDKIIEQDLIGRADAKKGKFRNFLLVSLDHYVVSQLRSLGAKKRTAPGMVPLSEEMVPPQGSARVGDAFDRAWATSLITETLRRMKQECMACGKSGVWGIFETRVLNPILHDASILTYEETASRFGFTSPSQASNALITAKRTFLRQLQSVIGEYAQQEEIDDEIADLRRVLAEVVT